MSLSIFGDKAVMPNEQALTAALAGTKAVWDNIENHVALICGEQSSQWKFYSKKAGWSLVMKSGDRTILYLIPQDAFFKVNFVFGDKAVAAALASNLPEQITALITQATPYAEGRSFLFDIKTAKDADTVKNLIAIKNTN